MYEALWRTIHQDNEGEEATNRERPNLGWCYGRFGKGGTLTFRTF